MADNPPPNPPNENASTSGNGPRAKKAKTSDPKSSDNIARLDATRGGSRKATLMLDIDDVAKFKADGRKVESEQVTLAGIEWRITADVNAGYVSVELDGWHPSMSEWHCKVDFTLHDTASEKPTSVGIRIFTHEEWSCGFSQWMIEEDLVDEHDKWSITCEMTAFNCYVTDGAFGCRSRFHDVTFDFGHRRLYTNKGFLAANAEYFEAMFFGDFVDKHKDVVTLKNVISEEFAEFLIALAPGPMPINAKNVFCVLRLADRFQAHELVERWSSFLLQEKWKIDFVKKLQIADKLLMSHLRDKLVESATTGEILKAAKLENESKFSKLTWIKLFREYIYLQDERNASETDSDA